MQPWKKIALTEEQLQIIYREWGVFYTHKQKIDKAAHYYDVSLDLKDDPKALYHRSRCKRRTAETAAALQDARAAMATDPLNQLFTLEVCDGLYQLNEFEKSKCEVFNNSLKFKGRKLREFHDRSDVLNENFHDTLGEGLRIFIMENKKYFYKALQEMRREESVDRRPLWKILKEQGECDVLSVLEKKVELLSPREIARRRRAFNIFNQIYMHRSWVDILFLKALRNDPNLLLPQSQWSKPLFEHRTQTKYDHTMKFVKMLHARSPLYTEKTKKCPNRKLSQKTTEDYLHRVQYQIHRNMLTILRKIKYLRSAKQVEKLSNYVEEVMGDYVVLKTHRVMPWKFEFINEVYNLLALAYIDQYLDTPKNIIDYKPEERLNVLLKMPIEKEKEPLAYVFGDKSTYQDEDAPDLPMIRHKALQTRMERRMIFAKYEIEKTYLLHEVARSHLKQGHFDECCTIAQKSIDEAKKCNSCVWKMLGILLICKAHTCLKRIENVHEVMLEAQVLAAKLKNPKLSYFIDLTYSINEAVVQQKRAADELRNAKNEASFFASKMSIFSME